jgi:hypothetical protein
VASDKHCGRRCAHARGPLHIFSVSTANPYDVLGVPHDASPAIVKEAWRDLAKVWHPDRFGSDPRLREKATERLKEINEAYEQIVSGKARPAATPKREEKTATPPPYTPPRWSGSDAYVAEHVTRVASRAAGPRRLTGARIALWFVTGTCAVLGALLLTDRYHARLASSALWPTRETAPPSEAIQPPRTPQSAPVTPRADIPTAIVPPERSAPAPVVIYPPEWQTAEAPATPHAAFTIGDKAAVVRRVQGEPDRVDGDVWHYGGSTVTFFGARVAGYTNPGGGLRVHMRPPAAPIARSTFTLGSSRELVVQLQGTPTAVVDNTWFYGRSTVSFTGGKVSGYANIEKNLRLADAGGAPAHAR